MGAGSWRGESGNPGRFEAFYGEVDDLLAAAAFVKALPYVDPARVYIAGRGTGGTLALLAAATNDDVRAVFSFGGAPDVGEALDEGRIFDLPLPYVAGPAAPGSGLYRGRVRTKLGPSMADARPSPLTLTLSGVEATYAKGALPDLKATLTNRAPKPVTVCAYMLAPRLLATITAEDAEGDEFELFPFRPGRWRPLEPKDFRTIPPQKAFSVKLPIGSSQVWGFVASGSQPPLVTNGHCVRGFSGEVIFRARLSDSAPLYVGQNGVYDRTWDWKTVPDELPGCPDPVPRCFRRRLEGRGVVRFG